MRFEVRADLLGHSGAGKAGGHHVEQYAGTLPAAGVAAGLVCLCFPVGGGFQVALCLGGVFIVVGQLGQLAVVLGFLADVAADGADGGVELPGNALLQCQFFFHPLAVKAVFQVACGGVGSLGTPIGVDAFRSLLYALSVAALLFGGVGNLNVSRADAASGGAALAVLLFLPPALILLSWTRLRSLRTSLRFFCCLQLMLMPISPIFLRPPARSRTLWTVW